MKIARIISTKSALAILLCVVIAGTILYIRGEVYKIRWSLTFDFSTPHGLRSASSEYTSTYYQSGGVVGGASADVRGEATIIDLGNGRYIFAVMQHGLGAPSRDLMPALPVTALTGVGPGWNAYRALRANKGHLEGTASLAPPLIPELVIFKDLNDPKSAEIVDPSDPSSFREKLGVGYELRNVILRVNSAGLSLFGNLLDTRRLGLRINALLPWLRNQKYYFNGKAGCNRRAEVCLQQDSFVRE